MIDLKILLSELVITNDDIPVEIADKLLEFHLWPMNKVRSLLNKPIWASKKSGWRPEWYEKKKGRTGTSEHTFKGKGAVDWTTKREDLINLLNLIIQYTNYSRVCYYPENGFIHCDHKLTPSGERQFFIYKKGKWEFQQVINKNFKYHE